MTTFDKVYAAVRLIPRGSVATYGQIAAAIGNKRLARVVGYALHVNPEPGVIPCHRVVKRDGEVSSAFAFGGANRQVELLKAEGVGFLDDSHVDMKHQFVGVARHVVAIVELAGKSGVIKVEVLGQAEEIEF